MGRRDVYLPPRFDVDYRVADNPVLQLGAPAYKGPAEVSAGKVGRTSVLDVQVAGRPLVTVVPRKLVLPDDAREVLLVPGAATPETREQLDALGSKTRWLTPAPLGRPEYEVVAAAQARCDLARNSWRSFAMVEEERSGGTTTREGLRPPQVGSIYAALAHWITTTDAATIVLPTGTGKTETMLALLAKEQLPRLLVVVPTDALRDQISKKFLDFGLLTRFRALGTGVRYPVVGILRHKPKTPEEVEEFFGRCNVIISTMAITGNSDPDVQRAMVSQTSHLFIDEAHHVSAATWSRFREQFDGIPVLQFTATPFRRDRRPVGGRIIFNYPLRKAQAEGYFKTIAFRPVWEFDPARSDQGIAVAAVDQLERDLQAGHDHLIMARTDTIQRAQDVHTVYTGFASGHSPLLIHSDMKSAERNKALEALRQRSSRIIVCVDMLGEGFDLPELKIAAVHDIHKSLAITLQFTGRFTRTHSNVGDATLVANIADANVDESLRALYAEDADWNLLLRKLSHGATANVIRKAEFHGRFSSSTSGIVVQNISPKMSTVVFRTGPGWHPDDAPEALGSGVTLWHEPSLNSHDNVLVMITREAERVPWGEVKELENITWHLYLIHWDAARNLLFINSSNNDSNHEKLAKKICGDSTELIRGEVVFRSMTGLKRILFMNMGLSHSISRAVRFTMYVGSDILENLAQATLQNKSKANLFGRGYESGEKTSIGCSRNGRIWAHRVAEDIDDWMQWCHKIGTKLQDSSATFDQVLPHVLRPTPVEDRPNAVPLVVEWSESAQLKQEQFIRIEFSGTTYPLFDVGIELTDHSLTGPLSFRVFTEATSSQYKVVFSGSGDQTRVDFVQTAGPKTYIISGTKRRPLEDWFREEPPVFRFSDGSFLIYTELIKANQSARQPFDRSRLVSWDWTGVNIRTESQTTAKLKDSIQYKVLQHVLSRTDIVFDIIMDDDDTNEAADVVALGAVDDRLVIHFYHCKYSSEDKPGARVDDLYEVCGQAQRSVSWKGDVEALFDHLRKRDTTRKSSKGVSRFERGHQRALQALKRRAALLTPDVTISIVQPGVSAAKCSAEQMELLATTELYLKETYALGFEVIVSP